MDDQHAGRDEREGGEVGLTAALAAAARAIDANAGDRDTYAVVAEQALTVVPGAEWACLSTTHLDGSRHIIAATDPIAVQAEKAQQATDEGPCIDASHERRTVESDDVSTDTRYPAYGKAAASIGVRAQLSADVFTAGPNRIALNLYSGQPAALADAAHAAELYASFAAVALGFARNAADLHDALAARARIGQAIGIIRERHHLDEHAAFHHLVKQSQDTNTKVRVIAQQVMDSVSSQ